jgi:hypothetical protein
MLERALNKQGVELELFVARAIQFFRHVIAETAQGKTLVVKQGADDGRLWVDAIPPESRPVRYRPRDADRTSIYLGDYESPPFA